MATFKSLNFKLVVIDHLLDQGHFVEQVESLKDKYWDDNNFDFEPIPEILAYFEQMEIPESLLHEITSLTFDGGLSIYQIVIPNWDGEDDQFDVDSLEDITLLPNLESLLEISMLTATDISPLLNLKKLKKVDWYAIKKDEDKANQLRQAGVEVG